MLLLLVFAFAAGLVTVASPCILPILPIAMSASAGQGRGRPLAVIVGLVLSFSAFTLVVAQLVGALGLPANTLRLLAVAVLALLGLSMVVPALTERVELLFGRLGRLGRLAPARQRSGWLGGLLAGAALGLVWAPCAGPVLAAITTLAATQRVSLAAVGVTAAYALGVGIPLLLIAYGGRRVVRRVPALSRRTGSLQRAFGVVIVTMALLIAINADVALTVWATSALPGDWNNRLQAFEDSAPARARLDRLVGRSGAETLGSGVAPVADQVLAAGAAASAAGAAQATGTPVGGQAEMAGAEGLSRGGAEGQGSGGAPAGDQVSAAVAVASAADAVQATGTPVGGQAGMLGSGGSSVVRTAEDTPAPRDGQVGSNAGAAPAKATGASSTALSAATATRGPSPTPTPARPTAVPLPQVPLTDQGLAPEFAGITGWLNGGPLTLAQLRGKVVLVDFWTYSCINCIRTLPYVTSWYNKYHDQGLVVVGVHTPEFAFERERANVQDAIARYGIKYPVAQDNDYATWTAYANRYWPAEYFIDAKGHVRHTHFGEGNYDETERVIQELLAEAGATKMPDTVGPAGDVPVAAGQTPETYVGLDRQERFASPEKPVAGQTQTFTFPVALPLHGFAVAGQWAFGQEFATAGVGSGLRLHFQARDVYLVLSSDTPAQVAVSLPGTTAPNSSEDLGQDGRIRVQGARLYHLVRLPAAGEGTVELKFDNPGVRVFAFTFGS